MGNSQTTCGSGEFCYHEYCSTCESCPNGAICDRNQGITEYCQADSDFNLATCSRITPSCSLPGQYFDAYSDYTTSSCESCPIGKTCPNSITPEACPDGQYADGDGICQIWPSFVGDCPNGMFNVPNSGKIENELQYFKYSSNLWN